VVAKFTDELLHIKQENFDIPEVATRHFKTAINRIKPSDVKFYQELAAQFRRFVDDMSEASFSVLT
jgi:hypothetical protein